jgi:transposase
MYLGIDTHKRSHVIVALDEHGRIAGTRSIVNTTEGWVMALQWAQEAATERSWGIENSGSWGKGFAQFLLTQGEIEVREVRPHRTAPHRTARRSTVGGAAARTRPITPMPWPSRGCSWPRARNCRRSPAMT